jgi:hypothetical protein
MEDRSHVRELAREFAEAVDAAKEKLTFLCTDGWAGRIETPCEILQETPKRFLVRLGEDCRLPGRHVKAGRKVYRSTRLKAQSRNRSRKSPDERFSRQTAQPPERP